jgi:hypothetical protein
MGFRGRVGFTVRVSGSGPRKLHPAPTRPVAIHNYKCQLTSLVGTVHGLFMPPTVSVRSQHHGPNGEESLDAGCELDLSAGWMNTRNTANDVRTLGNVVSHRYAMARVELVV